MGESCPSEEGGNSNLKEQGGTQGRDREGQREEKGQREGLCSGAGGGFQERLERFPMAVLCRVL